MKIRIARHTKDLKLITDFYLLIPGMEYLGGFKDHEGYEGAFIGMKDSDWHLEFTVSEDEPDHRSDEDDLLVFYAGSTDEYNKIIALFGEHDAPEVVPKNPFWEENGTTFEDPDGFKVVIAVPENK
jgi:hypothetical protein